MSERNKTLIGLHIAVLLAGATGLFGRFISLGELPLVWYRVIVSGLTLAAVLAATGHLHRISLKAVMKIAGCGMLLAVHWVAFFASIKHSNVSVGVVCIATSCFFTTIIDPLINRKRFSPVDMLISFITIAGILLIFSLDIRYRTGILLGLLSAAIYSLFSILNVNVARATGEDSSTMLLYEFLGGIGLLSILMPAYARLNPSAAMWPQASDMAALLLLGSIFTVIPFFLQINALRKLSPFTVNVSYNLEPVYSIIFAAVLFGETRELSAPFWAGLALVVISVLLQTRRSRL